VVLTHLFFKYYIRIHLFFDHLPIFLSLRFSSLIKIICAYAYFKALTFDDGPHGTLTPRLLAALKQKNVVVTFFVMGIKVEMHPEIVAAALQDGHEIGNHVREAGTYQLYSILRCVFRSKRFLLLCSNCCTIDW
jgi:peptidoglycan/xylan/chitin deacetylase (PgdA/CDA1 family)